MKNSFIVINKMSDPDKLDRMGLPIYEEFFIPLDGLTINKKYIEWWEFNGERYDNNPLGNIEDYYKIRDEVYGLGPGPSQHGVIKGGEYGYFVRSPHLESPIAVSSQEYKRLCEILSNNGTGVRNG